MITLSEFRHEIERQRDIYEDEIIQLNEELEHVKHVGGTIIDEYRRENNQLKDLLQKAGVQVPDKQQAEDKLTMSEEQKLAEYYALKKQQDLSQFKSPQVAGMDQYWDYGEENQTASANYRPRDSNTALRKPRARITAGLSAKSNLTKHSQPSKFQHSDDASFYKEPIHEVN